MIRRKLRALAAVAALTIGIGAALPAIDALAVTLTPTYTSCSSSGFVGTRVCVDRTVAGHAGAVAFVYTSSTTIAVTIDLNGTAGLIPALMGTMYDWDYLTPTTSEVCGIPNDPNNPPIGCLEFEWGAGDTLHKFGTATEAEANQLSWFSNSSGYEIVVAN